jgi:hypothetical protein
MTTAFTHPLAGVMDRHGMLPEDWPCLRCGRKLNADGGHPAELYAGTWNGLCYPCTSAGPYIEKISWLDGCRKVSWPPHCPSWRRTREDHYAYPGCETCKGLGIVPGTRSAGYRAGESCKPCRDRMNGNPVRKGCWDASEQLMRDWQERFGQALLAAQGLPARASRKRRQAALEAMDPQELASLKGQYLAAYQRDRTEYTEHIAWADPWRMPTPEEQI